MPMTRARTIDARNVVIGLNAVIVAVTREVPRILTVQTPQPPADGRKRREPFVGEAKSLPALPFGLLDPAGDKTLDQALRHSVRQQTGLPLGYVEQLYTFGDRFRVPEEQWSGSRVAAVAYLALMSEEELSGVGGARWMDWYNFFPWEDWRAGRPDLVDRTIAPALIRWARAASGIAGVRQRRERVDIAFGLGGAPWDGERVLERYELLYEVGLVQEATYPVAGRKRMSEQLKGGSGRRSLELPGIYLGQAMTLDHRRMLATALGRLRGKLKYRPLVFELLPATFTLLKLQRVVEALAGVRLHKQNFRRLVEKGGLVEGTGRVETGTGGRPAELFRFRREVLRERPAPGVSLPGFPSR